LAKNERLVATIKPELAESARESRRTGRAARSFKDYVSVKVMWRQFRNLLITSHFLYIDST